MITATTKGYYINKRIIASNRRINIEILYVVYMIYIYIGSITISITITNANPNKQYSTLCYLFYF